MRIQDRKSLFLTKSLPAVDHFQVNFKEIGTQQINLKGKCCCLTFQVYLLCNPRFKPYSPVYPIHSLFQLFSISISLVISLLFLSFFLFHFILFLYRLKQSFGYFIQCGYYIVWPIQKNNVTYIQPFRAGGAQREPCKVPISNMLNQRNSKIKRREQALIIINIEHQYQSFTTNYKILSYSNEQSCLDIGIRNRSRCQSLLGNYSSGWRV